MKNVFVSIALMMTTTAAIAHSAVKPSSPNIVDLGPALERYLQKSKSLTMSDKTKLFTDIVVSPQARAFDKLVFRGKNAQEFLASRLAEQESKFEAAVNLAKDFEPIIKQTLSEYHRVFPNADYGYTLLLMPSFDFDGKADELADGTILVAFGIDRLARYKRENLKIVVAHEMFHALQMQYFKTTTKKSMTLTRLWHETWVEGLATYASAVLNKLATADEVLGNKNVAGCKNDLKAQKNLLIENFDAETEKIPQKMDEWFGGHQFAYCLGFVAIRELAQKQSLPALLEWPLGRNTRNKLRDKILTIDRIDG